MALDQDETRAGITRAAQAPARLLLHDIRRPGAYVTHLTGDLVRIVEAGGIASEEAALTAKHGGEPVYVTCISIDPFIPITDARIVAANMDLEVAF